MAGLLASSPKPAGCAAQNWSVRANTTISKREFITPSSASLVEDEADFALASRYLGHYEMVEASAT